MFYELPISAAGTFTAAHKRDDMIRLIGSLRPYFALQAIMLNMFFLAVLCLFFTGGVVSVGAEAPNTIAAGSVTLIVEDGKVYASGDAGPCRGDDEKAPRNHFKPIASLSKIKEVALCTSDSSNAAAVDGDGNVWVWGNDWQEVVKPADRQPPHIPFQHPMLKDITSIAMGKDHLVALEKSGSVVAVATNSSANHYGSMGNGLFGGIRSLDQVVNRLPGIDDAVAVEAGVNVTLVLRSDGTVWGSGYKPLLGQPTSFLDLDAGDPEKAGVATPIKIAGLKNIQSISVGHNFVVALDSNGQVWGWGLNGSGQLGPDLVELRSLGPHRLPGLRDVVAISAGYDFILALTKSGKVMAQGCNVHGTLGDDGNELEGRLRTIADLTSVSQISAGHANAFARTKDGTLLGWGNNDGSVGGFAAEKDPLVTGVTKFDVKTKAPKPSAKLSNGGVKAIVWMEHNGYSFEREELQLTIGESKLSFAVDEAKDEVKQIIEIPAGTTSYTVHGMVVTDEGQKHEVKSTGIVVVSDASFESYFETLAEQKKLVPAIKAAVSRFLPEGLQTPLRLQTFDAWTEMELEEFEARAKVRLPAAYKKAALETGFFSLGYENSPHPLVSLLPPDLNRNLEQYTAKVLATSSDSLADGPFKEVCAEMPYFEATLPRNRTDWKSHLILGTSGEYVHLLFDAGAGRAPSSTWTRLFAHDYDNYEEGDPAGYFNWKERGQDKVDFNHHLTNAACEALAKILETSGVTPLISTPTNQPVYMNIDWAGEDEPKEGETLEYQLLSDGW